MQVKNDPTIHWVLSDEHKNQIPIASQINVTETSTIQAIIGLAVILAPNKFTITSSN
jgi:hypothetical protein